MSTEETPDPEFVARQLRKPSGDFAGEIAEKMNQANKPLYDLALDVLELDSGTRLLEIGFGSGMFFDELFSRGEELTICGIDYSEKMVESARELNRTAIDEGRLSINWGESDALPYEDNSFDEVFCNMVVYFWDEPGPHLKEVFRVLKPGGTFYTGMRTRESMQVFPFVEYGFKLYTVDEWEETLTRNGFLPEHTHERTDPQIELDGRQLELKSCCVVARKP